MPYRFRILVLPILLALSACASGPANNADGKGLLPPPPADAKFSSYTPDHPYTQLADGILTRTLYQTSDGHGMQVEVRDLLVGPHRHSASVTLPGAAIFEVQGGSGTISLDGGAQDLHGGSTLSIAEGQSFSIENKGDEGIAIRAHLFHAK